MAETTGKTRSIGSHLGGHLRESGMLIALVAIVAFFTIIVRVTINVDFLSAQNITNLFLQNSYVIIMALGMLLAVQIAAGVLAFVVMIVLSRHPLMVEVKRQFCRSEKMKMLLRAG